MQASRSPSTARPASPAAGRAQARAAPASAFTPIRHILCPVDFSDHSRGALRHAVELARKSGARITGLYVMPFIFAGEGSPEPLPPEPEVVAATAKDLERFLRPAREAGLEVRVLVRSGSSVDQILEQAEEGRADLVVMGTHGRSGLERLVMGSVTRSVLRKAPCPVLTVPRADEGRPAPAEPRRILCAVRLTESSGATLSYALALGRSLGADVVLVHAVPSRRDPVLLERRVSEGRERLRAAVQALGEPGGPVEEVVVAGRAHREILRLAAARQADVVVLGVQGRGPGPTDDHVLSGAEVPVLTVRSPGSARRA